MGHPQRCSTGRKALCSHLPIRVVRVRRHVLRIFFNYCVLLPLFPRSPIRGAIVLHFVI